MASVSLWQRAFWRKSPLTRLAAATQSTACAQEFKNALWDGDRLITSSFDLTDQRQLENFVSRAKYSLGDDVQVLLANVGEVTESMAAPVAYSAFNRRYDRE